MSIKDCLTNIGFESSSYTAYFNDCQSLDEEWQVIKKQYFKKIRISHPDKGGDAAVFRKVQTSFEVLRDIFDKNTVSSFINELTHDTSSKYESVFKDFSSKPTPSWEYYEAAAEEAVPTYKIELAKSGRSRCVAKGKAKKCQPCRETGKSLIEKGEVRIGYFEKQSGQYIRWVHLCCWRVPSRIWLGLPDPEKCDNKEFFEQALIGMNELLLTGFSQISDEKKSEIIDHVMNKENYARLTKRKVVKKAESNNNNNNNNNSGSSSSSSSSSMMMMMTGSSSSSSNTNTTTTTTTTVQGSTAIVSSKKKRYIIPKPGKNGALTAKSQNGTTFVMTGIFPELGGGGGLNLGKGKLKALIVSFGGRVTSSVSGKTNILVVGKNPGYSKVSKARRQPNCKLMSLKDLTEYFEGDKKKIESVKPMLIENFSAGYGSRGNNFLGNGLASNANSKDLAIAQGTKAPPANEIKAKRKKRKSKSSSAKSKNAKKKPKTKKSKKEEKADVLMLKEVMYAISCDSCGIDCTLKSFFISKTSEDFCEECYQSNGKKKGKGIQQKNGVACI